MKILCSLQTFVTVAYFVQWRLQHGTYFPDKTQSTEFLRWYLMIVSIYKLQYIWICCQFLSQLLKLIFNVIKTGLNSPPSPWEELIQSCRWKSGISWACCQSLSPLLKLIFTFIENLIDFTSIALGIDKNLLLKTGTGWAQSIAWANKWCKSLWLSSFWSEKSLLLGQQHLVVKVLLAWFDDQRLAYWEKLKFLCLCLMF